MNKLFSIREGEYQRVEDPVSGKMIVVPGSYTTIEADAPGLFDLFLALELFSIREIAQLLNVPAPTLRFWEEKGLFSVVVPGSYTTIEADAPGLFDLFLALEQGYVEAADIMFLIIFAYGFVYVLLGSFHTFSSFL